LAGAVDAVRHHLDNFGLPLWVEAPLLIGATTLGCWLLYGLGLRAGPLRAWFGLSATEPRARVKPA